MQCLWQILSSQGCSGPCGGEGPVSVCRFRMTGVMQSPQSQGDIWGKSGSGASPKQSKTHRKGPKARTRKELGAIISDLYKVRWRAKLLFTMYFPSEMGLCLRSCKQPKHAWAWQKEHRSCYNKCREAEGKPCSNLLTTQKRQWQS